MVNKLINKHLDLIYDVGMHKGEDTDYYLKKGFKVIGFEADPDLINYCRKKFRNELENGSLIIVEGAIVKLDETIKGETLKFYKNIDNSVWGTIERNWAIRNEHLGTFNKIIEVPIVDFSACVAKYGIPYYLKIDIEGLDKECLKALMQFNLKPDFVSIESEKASYKKLKEELNLLQKLGYTQFKAINQAEIYLQREPIDTKEGRYLDYRFQNGASGLFGTDLPKKWKNYSQIHKIYKFIFIGYRLFGDSGIIRNYLLGKVLIRILSRILKISIPGWYDTHAKHCSIASE